MSNVHTVASSEDQRSMLQNLNEDTFRKLFYSLPRHVVSTFSEKIFQGFPKSADSNLPQPDTLQQSSLETSDRREGKILEEYISTYRLDGTEASGRPLQLSEFEQL